MTDRPLCAACGTVLRFVSDDGHLLAWCPTCRTQEPVPLIGQRVYDQREVLEYDLAQHARSGMNRPRHPGQPRRGRRLLPLGVRTRKDAEP